MTKIIDKIRFWRQPRLKKFLGFVKKPKFAIPLVAAVIIVIGALAVKTIYFSPKNEAVAEEAAGTEVKTVTLDFSTNATGEINTVGTVNADASVDIVALAGGTVRSLLFKVGDEVLKNQLLAQIKNEQYSANYLTSQAGLANALNTLEQAQRVADDAIKQAQIGVDNSQKTIEQAQIGLQSAQDNLANVTNLQDKDSQDTKNNAVIAFSDFINTADNALEQVNYILDVNNEGVRLPGIGSGLGAKDPTSVTKADGAYTAARAAYNGLRALQPTADTITDVMKQVVIMLNQTRLAVNDTITVLDNTVTSLNFTDASLNAQKQQFANLNSGVVNTLNGAQQTLDGLENTGLVNKQDMDVLANAVKAAENQLAAAQVGYDNALAVLDAARQAKAQQLAASQTAVDAARGQRDVLGTQIADLSITSPIAGKITAKAVEVGTEVSPGQKIATVARTNVVKIEINLPSEDIYRIRLGQEAVLENNATGTVTLIDPAADPITKKVRAEIVFDNRNGELITGTFINVTLPVAQLEKTTSDSVFIPLRAVSVTQTENYVFTVATDPATGQTTARKTTVTIGSTQGALIEIVDGLHNGDELIVEGNKSLEDGDVIKVVN